MTLEKPNIFQRVLAIMGELSYIQKGAKTVNGQYRFTSHDQVTAAIHPLLVKHGVLPVPTTKEVTQDGNRTMVKLIVSFVNVDNPVDCYSVEFPGYGVDASDKGPGKAVSYAFKIACLKAFCLETGEDPDNDAKSLHEPARCLEFDLLIPHTFTEAEKKKLSKFLSETAEAHGKNVEEIKQRAIGNMEQFLDVFKKWSTKK